MRIRISNLSFMRTPDVLADDLSKGLALVLGNPELKLADLARAVSLSQGRGTVGASTDDLVHVGEIGARVTDGDVDYAVVGKEGDSSESGRLLPTVLGGSRSEDRSKFADQGTLGPNSTSAIEEGADLGNSAAVSGWEAEEVPVVLLKLFNGDHGVVGARSGTHLLEDVIGKGLRDLEEFDFSTGLSGTLGNLLSQG